MQSTIQYKYNTICTCFQANRSCVPKKHFYLFLFGSIRIVHRIPGGPIIIPNISMSKSFLWDQSEENVSVMFLQVFIQKYGSILLHGCMIKTGFFIFLLWLVPFRPRLVWRQWRLRTDMHKPGGWATLQLCNWNFAERWQELPRWMNPFSRTDSNFLRRLYRRQKRHVSDWSLYYF